MKPGHFNPFVRLVKLDWPVATILTLSNKSVSKIIRRSPCYFCKLKFKWDSNGVERHMATHTREKWHKCFICSKKFYGRLEKNDHVNSVHKSNGHFKCPETNCKYKCTSARIIFEHLCTHRGLRPLKCTICSITFNRLSNLNRHMKGIHDPKNRLISQCPTCQKKVLSTTLKTHIERVHENVRNHPCKFQGCSKRFSTRVQVRNHMRKFHLGEEDLTKCPHKNCQLVFQSKYWAGKQGIKCSWKDPNKKAGFSCESCPEVFYSKQELLSHLTGVHLKEKMFKCQRPSCGKTFVNKNSLRAHEINHVNKDSGILFNCIACGHKYTHRGSLSSHECSARPDSWKERIICYFCGSSLSSALISIKGHLRLHTREKPFKCPNTPCLKTFHVSQRVRHHGLNCPYGDPSQIKYKCKLCQRPFYRNEDFEKHIAMVHTGERAFKCDKVGCGKAFAYSGGLSAHLRTHLDMESRRNFTCNKCNKMYKSSTGLAWHLFHIHGAGRGGFHCYFCDKRLSCLQTFRVHILSHTKERPFKCTQCMKRFKWLTTRNNHFQKHHQTSN